MGITYLSKQGFSINEGGGPFNIHVRWYKPIGFYIYFCGHSFHWFKKASVISNFADHTVGGGDSQRVQVYESKEYYSTYDMIGEDRIFKSRCGCGMEILSFDPIPENEMCSICEVNPASKQIRDNKLNTPLPRLAADNEADLDSILSGESLGIIVYKPETTGILFDLSNEANQ